MNKTDLSKQDVEKMIQKFHFSEEIQQIINNENLLPLGVLNRLNSAYPDYSTFNENADFIFHDKEAYIGLKGFREVVEILSKNGIIIDHLEERELFIQVYRFMVTKHILNLINWKNFQNDSLFQLVFPQPGMMRKEIKDKYHNAKTPEEKKQVINDYFIQTNPHDGHQKLNKPVFVNADGEIEIIEGSQHKYPLCQLIFDKETQNCFAFCSYCFRHAQVRGDRDMFIQKDISQVHRYLKMHKEVSDILITGGDAAYITPERFEEYIDPFINDPELLHIKSVRLGTRILTYYPEKILSRSYESMLKLFKKF